MRVKARNNQVFVRILKAEEKKPEGQIIHEQPDETKLNKELIQAEVIAVGPKVYDVEEGNRILLPGTFVTRKSAEHIFIEESEIEAVIG